MEAFEERELEKSRRVERRINNFSPRTRGSDNPRHHKAMLIRKIAAAKKGDVPMHREHGVYETENEVNPKIIHSPTYSSLHSDTMGTGTLAVSYAYVLNSPGAPRFGQIDIAEAVRRGTNDRRIDALAKKHLAPEIFIVDDVDMSERDRRAYEAEMRESYQDFREYALTR